MTEQPIQVAVVHSDRGARDALRSAVLRCGYDVCCEAASGSRFVEQASSAQPDVAIVQERLSDMNGLHAAQRAAGQRDVGAVLIRDTGDGQVPKAPELVTVLAVLHAPVRSEDLATSLPLAVWRFQELKSLREEISDLLNGNPDELPTPD